jgi:leader peptidase (prepilin peptidase)/N-methyltransferase
MGSASQAAGSAPYTRLGVAPSCRAARIVTLLVAIFVVLFGLAFGSFLNVCIARLPGHGSLLRPASHCPKCLVPIRPADNIPLLSWLLLGCRCRDCSARISMRYPLVEASTAALFLGCWMRYGLTTHGVGLMVFCFLVLGLGVMDWETMLLPDGFTIPGIALGYTYGGLAAMHQGASFWHGALYRILWSASAFALISFIRAAYWIVRRQEGMGMGDAKLLAMIAAWLGPWLAGVTLFAGVLGAALYGAILLLRHRGGAASLRLPFGSFLCGGTLFAVFRGEQTINWYMRFLR